METEHSEIRQDIERARDELAEKTSELSHRAADAASRLRLSHQVDERPLTVLALSVVAGFAMERIFFGHREKVIVIGDGEQSHKRRRKRRARRKLERAMTRRAAEGDDSPREAERDEPGRAMGSVMAMGQMAATALAREVATRLLHRDHGDDQRPRA